MFRLKTIDYYVPRKAAVVAYALLVTSFSLPSIAEQSNPSPQPNNVSTKDFYDLSLEELMDVKVECDGKKNA